MAKVDVIITCYNKEQTIARAIECVKRQTLTDFQCLVIDDGSTDTSREVILNAIKDDDRFSYSRLENCGVANARNYGASLGKSKYITCLDGDDGLQPEFLQTCYNAIIKDSSLGIVYTDILLAHIDGYFTVAKWPDADHEKQFEGYNQIPCCNMFRRDIFERLGGYRQRYAPKGAGAEDAELWLRFFKLGYRAKKVSNEPLFIYNTFGGLTQNTQYKEVNWTNWHTTTPFASLQKPENGISHLVHQYDNPEISVIIPVGPGHEHYLIDALDSLEAQTFVNWEAIVVFDNANFNDALNTAYPYVKFIQNKTNRHGAGIARNIGVKQAHGDKLVFLDCDDYLQPRFFELTLSAMNHFNADWIYTDLYTQVIYNEAQYQLKVNALDDQNLYHRVMREKDDWKEFIYRYNCDEWNVEKLWTSGISAVTALYRKSDFELVNGFDESNNREDWDFHMRLAQAGKCGLRLPLPLFTYRLHTGIRREYKDITNSPEQSKALKQRDIERIHNSYNQKELQMACTACKKNKINIKPAHEADFTVLEYTGKISGGTIRGPATQQPYALQRDHDKTIIQRVHPQDAQLFVQSGIFKPIPITNKKSDPIVSPTPKKVVVKETVKPQPKWYESSDAYNTVSSLKETIENRNPTQSDLKEIRNIEAQNKNRITALRYLDKLIEQE